MQRDAADDDLAVAAFLRANPGWLAAHPELFAVLDPPRRVHGEAMADHMAAMLAQARRHGTEAAAGRRAADSFSQRVQLAVLALMRAADPVWCLQHEIGSLLQVDSVRLLTEPGVADLALGQRTALVRDAGPNRRLHGEAAPLTVREALCRVRLATAAGLLAIGVRDPAALDGATTPVLGFLGEAVAAALDRA